MSNSMRISWHQATAADLELLAAWNHQLIADEGHRNPMNVQELRERMEGWMASEYKALIFSAVEPVGYALFKIDADSIFLRQFFFRRDKRRLGFGRLSFGVLKDQIWPEGNRLIVDVLCSNLSAIAFWRSLGYKDYSLSLEIMPSKT